MEKKDRKPKGYWTYERCYETALKYTKKSKFEAECPGAYEAARKAGWLKDYDWLVGIKHTYENCYSIALGYEYLSDFRKNDILVYTAAYKKGWLKDYVWLKKGGNINGPWAIYAYEDVDNKVAYIGLSVDVKERHNAHRREQDIVYSYFASKGKEFNYPKIKMDELETAEDAQYYEDWYKKAYEKIGWTVLNVGKTGVGVSSLGRAGKRSEEEIREICKKYKNRNQLFDNERGVYNAASKMNLLDECFPKYEAKPYGYWKNIKNHFKEIIGCENSGDYYKKCQSGYNAALKYGFIDTLFPKTA